LTSVQIWFESIQNAWLRAIGLNFEPFDQIPNFVFINGLNLSEIGNSLKSKSLDLSCISYPSSAPISERMSKFISFESKFWVGLQIRFVEFPYSLIYIFESNFEIFQTLNSNSFDINPWIILSNFYLWESSNTYIQIQISFWIHSNQPPKILNSNSYSFSTFGPIMDAAH
jgi:hypothetical protein